MWRRSLAVALSLPGVAFILAAFGNPEMRPVAIIVLLIVPSAILLARWRRRRSGGGFSVADFLRVGTVTPALVLALLVALENPPALKILQAALGGAVFGIGVTTAGIALAYARRGRLPGTRVVEPLASAKAPPVMRGADPRVKATGRVVDPVVEGVTGRTEHQCQQCGAWTLVADPICRACGRPTEASHANVT